MSNEAASPYAGLSRADLELRLRLAEDACVMYGWCASRDDSDRDKAARHLWMRWATLVGSDYTSPRAHPELAASEHALARERDATRQRLLNGG
jgi:hypothetical protein